MSRIVRLLAVALLAAPAALPAAASAAPPAAPRLAPAAPTQPANATFGIQPASPTGPDSRPQFQFGATKGAVVRDQVVVRNYGDKALTLQVYASDAFNTPEGGFDLLAAGRNPVDVGAWTKLDRTAVAVPARGQVVVPFTLTVPADVMPGDHIGGIVASMTTTQTDAQGNKVAVDQRVGARIYLRVPGLLRATLSVDALSADFAARGLTGGGTATVSYTVRNTGNVRIAARQQLALSAALWTDPTAPVLPELPELLPGASMELTYVADGVPPVGLLTAQLRLEPKAVGTDLNPTMISVSRRADFWALTWVTVTIAVGVLLVITGLVLLVLLLRRRRRRLAAATSTRGNRATVSV
ncbi:WxL protein peptidoglycan domain-containing protein [Catellatospora citrea]|uniref:DUF916 domain-containing protein n=1 Tax=Catellatospora citrea TaxID=53366 RepID=A0A8J3NXW7_9ACTN|nr:DUF916 domain-containing protein [Catellatospora citrea]GIF96732.1 hypothetical protein Cci01nite_18260 [Catellatospora citrea]